MGVADATRPGRRRALEEGGLSYPFSFSRRSRPHQALRAYNRKVFSGGVDAFLNRLKAAAEFVGRRRQQFFGIKFKMAGARLTHLEKRRSPSSSAVLGPATNLVWFALRLPVPGFDLGGYFRHFFPDFFQGALRIGPVEADIAGFFCRPRRASTQAGPAALR